MLLRKNKYTMDKNTIRKLMSDKRKLMTSEEIKERSFSIFLNLKKLEVFENAGQLLCYINIKNEVMTNDILRYFWTQNKKTAAPKVLGNKMDFYYFSNESELLKGYFDIPEPADVTDDNRLVIDKEDVIIIPGLAFDIKGGRVGYGKGFYDKYMTKNKNLTKIAIAYDFQISENIIETSEYDVKPDYIVTDKRVIKVLQG